MKSTKYLEKINAFCGVQYKIQPQKMGVQKLLWVSSQSLFPSENRSEIKGSRFE